MKTMLKGLAIGMAATLLLGGCNTAPPPADDAKTTTTVISTSMSDNVQTSTTSRQISSTSTTGMKGTGGLTKGTRPPADGSGETQDQTKASTKVHTTRTGTFPPPPSPPRLGTIRVAGLDNCYFALNASKNEWNRQIREQLASIEQRLNGKFQLTIYKSTDDLADGCIKAHKAGIKFADIMVAPLHLQKKLTAAKALRDLNQVEGLDLTKSYWDQNARRDMRLYGKNFAALTTLDGTAANANVLYFNKVLAKQVDSSDTELYKMVKNGTWTFDAMRRLSAKALKDIDGKSGFGDNDQYGFGGMDMRSSVSLSIFKAQGGYFTSPTKDGGVVYTLDNASNITALRGMQSWLLKDKSVYYQYKKEDDWSKTPKAFTEGRLLFMGWSADAAENFNTMKNDWGILPYPMAEKGGKYVSTMSWNTPCFSIPSQVKKDDLADAATALDAIARQFDKIKDSKRAYNTRRVFRDGTKSQEMLDIAGANATIDFCQFGELGEGGLTLIHYLYNSIGNDPKTVVVSRKENAAAALNTYLKMVR